MIGLERKYVLGRIIYEYQKAFKLAMYLYSVPSFAVVIHQSSSTSTLGSASSSSLFLVYYLKQYEVITNAMEQSIGLLSSK
jgi:hypothetical protein